MKLADMTDAEKSALGGLIRLVVRLDASYSGDEVDEVQSVATELGAEDFWAMMRKAGEMDEDEQEIKRLALAVDRQEAQEMIYGVLFSIAVADSIMPHENELLDWLAESWKLEIVEEPPPE